MVREPGMLKRMVPKVAQIGFNGCSRHTYDFIAFGDGVRDANAILWRMTRALILAALVIIGDARAAEPLVGTWRLERQELNGEKTDFEPLTLRISQSRDKFTFAFSMPVHNIHYVSMSYTVRLDGTEGDVKNGNGEKLGDVKITRAGPSQYKLVLRGPNRPQTSGTLTISSGGKTLTSESDAMQAGRAVHLMQLFARP
jgi:hypothetical protein